MKYSEWKLLVYVSRLHLLFTPIHEVELYIDFCTDKPKQPLVQIVIHVIDSFRSLRWLLGEEVDANRVRKLQKKLFRPETSLADDCVILWE